MGNNLELQTKIEAFHSHYLLFKNPKAYESVFKLNVIYYFN